MEVIKRLEPLWLALVMLGAINWGLVGLFDTNLVTKIFGSGGAVDVVYVVFGVAALMFVPRLLDQLGHIGGHRMRPHGA